MHRSILSSTPKNSLPAMQAKMWFSFFVVLYRPMSAGWHIEKMRFCRQARF